MIHISFQLLAQQTGLETGFPVCQPGVSLRGALRANALAPSWPLKRQRNPRELYWNFTARGWSRTTFFDPAQREKYRSKSSDLIKYPKRSRLILGYLFIIYLTPPRPAHRTWPRNAAKLVLQLMPKKGIYYSFVNNLRSWKPVGWPTDFRTRGIYTSRSFL